MPVRTQTSKTKKNDIYVMYDKEMTLSFDYNIEP